MVLEEDFPVGPLASPLDQRGVRGDPIDPGAERRPALEAADLAEQGQEDVLDDFLGVGLVAGDAVGETVHPGSEALHQALERGLLPAA